MTRVHSPGLAPFWTRKTIFELLTLNFTTSQSPFVILKLVSAGAALVVRFRSGLHNTAARTGRKRWKDWEVAGPWTCRRVVGIEHTVSSVY